MLSTTGQLYTVDVTKEGIGKKGQLNANKLVLVINSYIFEGILNFVGAQGVNCSSLEIVLQTPNRHKLY